MVNLGIILALANIRALASILLTTYYVRKANGVYHVNSDQYISIC